ncbi:DNA-directed RNA polymerase subunit A'' [Nanobdella aerobiophila]|uniref:DNA-directed RNA polymerase n=1 Tax=Nanobdella aerobiophila TaxID=2586965 RepID=A0A915WSK2_9ARCH|nr:DNA-directed RNA polymerase subunit A'' [Nanobdella aerobiophila]BBL45297.1 DNA-directed RNA polymerase subunit A'' [Nanobdella aerobiophila]
MDLPKRIKEEVEKSNNKELYSLVENFYNKMKIDPGEPIGIITAQSIGEPTTQMILRSFHFVGIAQSQASLGLPRLVEITDARKKMKGRYMIIRLLDEYKNDIKVAEDVAKKLKELLLEDLIQEVSIDIFENKIIIELDENKMNMEDINKTELIKLLKKRLKRYTVNSDNNIVEVILKKGKPSELYLLKDNIKKMLIKGIKGIKDVTISQENNEYILYAIGSNLQEVMKIPEVDYTKVYTNDIKEIEKILGIEAARNAIFNEIKKLYNDQGLNVDNRHFMLLADVLTWYGSYLGINRYGLHAEKDSVLSKAAFETPIPIFMRASMMGESDPVLSSIDNIIINQPIFLGTGLYNIFYQAPKNKE